MPVTDAGQPDARGVATPRNINPPHYFGLALLTMGLLRWFVAAPPGQFAKAGTNIVPLTHSTALVTDGMFARSRNPMYTSMVAIVTGVALVLDRWAPWIVVPVFVAILRLRFIRHEERLMEATFGQSYLDYKARVRRWL